MVVLVSSCSQLFLMARAILNTGGSSLRQAKKKERVSLQTWRLVSATLPNRMERASRGRSEGRCRREASC